VRVAIAGAGNIGRSIANAVLAAGHKVLLIERQRPHYRPELAPDADWMLADACELAALQAAGVDTADVVIAATGDDKVNLVFAMLCKTEFAVKRVVARVNNPDNHWLFTASWGIDVAVSTTNTVVAVVEQAASVGGVVALMSLQHGQGTILEITLPAGSRLVGRPLAELDLPAGSALLAVCRDGAVVNPAAGLVLSSGDEIVLLAGADVEAPTRARLLSALNR
jgi:trk system potassium uptake protein